MKTIRHIKPLAWLFPVILVICFVCSCAQPAVQAQPVVQAGERTKELVLQKRYLNLPVQNEVKMQRMYLVVEGDTVRGFNIELAVNQPDFWVFIETGNFEGKKAILHAENVPAGAKGFDMIYQDDIIKDEDTIYKEKLRQQFHFSSRRGWNNDPNGLVYYDGEYHLFYQHNPYGWEWGNMHWAHAVSTDLIHWKEIQKALFPDEFGTMFSGSAVIDHNNTSGFQTGEEKVLVAVYTADGPEREVQCIAFSNDRGRTFTKYEGNPVIGDRIEEIGSRQDRDPKVFWHEPTQKWVMALFEATGISIFTSDNLKDWNYESHTQVFWECPELFELPVDGDPNNKKWVMYGASGTYMIGDFDGKKFTRESGKHYYHWGILYAAQTYNDVPDGRRIQIGWGVASSPGMPFNMMMTFPMELSLRTTSEGIRLFSEPIREIKKLHGEKFERNNVTLTRRKLDLSEDIKEDLLHIKAEFEIKTAVNFGFNINGFEIEYDINHNRLNDVFLSPLDNKINLEILVDRNSIEIYANHGRLFLSSGHNSADNPKQLELFSRGETILTSLEVYELKSIWQ